MNKAISHLHTFLKKLTYHCFKSSLSIYSSWIDNENFLHFSAQKNHISSTSVVSSLSPPRCFLSSNRHCHAAASCHTSFLWSQYKLIAPASFFSNASSCRLLSWVETEVLNPHHHRRPHSSDHPTPTLYCYKNIISTLTTLPITLSRLHFTSSLDRVTHHRSSTYGHHFLSLPSHAPSSICTMTPTATN
jgi:hypothetical protein